MAYEKTEELAVGLFDRGAIRYAESEDEFWTLKSGRKSPVYVNLRGVSSFSPSLPVSMPEQIRTRQLVVEAYQHELGQIGYYDHVMGIPHALTCLSGLVAQQGIYSVLSMRSGEKSYGAHKAIEGDYEDGDVVALLDDVVTDGGAKLEIVEGVRLHSLQVDDVVVLVDREEGGQDALAAADLNLFSALRLANVTTMLRENNKVTEQQTEWMRQYYDNLIAEGLIKQAPAI